MVQVLFFFSKKKQSRSFGSEASNFGKSFPEAHILCRISWRIQWYHQNPAGILKSTCNSRQFMTDQNFRKILKKCFLFRILRRIEWYHSFCPTAPESSSKPNISISRFVLYHFSLFSPLLSWIFSNMW